MIRKKMIAFTIIIAVLFPAAYIAFFNASAGELIEPEMIGGAYRYDCYRGEITGTSSYRLSAADNPTIPRFSGDGYTYLVAANDKLEMQINVPDAGYYTVYIAASSQSAGETKCDKLYINGSYPLDSGNTECYIFADSFSGTWTDWSYNQPGSFNYTTWSTDAAPAEGFYFSAGTNTVTIVSNWGYCAYDSVILVPKLIKPVTDIVTGELRYECEEAPLHYGTNSARIKDNSGLFTGGCGGFGFVKLDSGSFTMEINVPAAGNYKVQVIGSSDSEWNKCDYTVINDNWNIVMYPPFDGIWKSCMPGKDDWSSGSVALTPQPENGFYFTAGKNTVKFESAWGYAYYDSVILTPVPDVPEIPVLQPEETDGSYRYDFSEAVLPHYEGLSVVANNDSFTTYTGGGYVSLTNGTLLVKFDVPATGNYIVRVVSGNTDGNAKCDRISFNGGTQYLVATPGTALTWFTSEPGEEYWNNGLIPVPPEEGFFFEEGENTLVLSANWGYCSYDSFILEPYTPMNIAPEIKDGTYIYEFEKGRLMQDVETVTNEESFSEFSGDGYVTLRRGRVILNIEVPAAGNYDVYILSGNTDWAEKCDYIKINGGSELVLPTPGFSNKMWTATAPGAEIWKVGHLIPEVPAEGYAFTAGVNKIEMYAAWGWCSYDSVVLVPSGTEFYNINADALAVEGTDNETGGTASVPRPYQNDPFAFDDEASPDSSETQSGDEGQPGTGDAFGKLVFILIGLALFAAFITFKRKKALQK